MYKQYQFNHCVKSQIIHLNRKIILNLLQLAYYEYSIYDKKHDNVVLNLQLANVFRPFRRIYRLGMLNSFFFQIRTSFLKFEFYSNFV